MTTVKPLLYLVQAEKRLEGPELRDFEAEPWMRGEGPRFWTVERLAALKAENEKMRREKK